MTQLRHVYYSEYLQNTETLQLFTTNTKQTVFTKAIKNDNLESLCWSN
jgi:hypothetical protein